MEPLNFLPCLSLDMDQSSSLPFFSPLLSSLESGWNGAREGGGVAVGGARSLALAAADADFIGGGAQSGAPFKKEKRRGRRKKREESIVLTWPRSSELLASTRIGGLEVAFPHEQLCMTGIF